MSVADVSLFELVQGGTLVPDYGAIISVSNGVFVPKAVEWLINNVGARLPKGVKSPLEGTQSLFIGPPGGLPYKVVVTPDFTNSLSHLALRARDQESFCIAQKWLESAGFNSRLSAMGALETERWFDVMEGRSLGLTIHLAWRKEVPKIQPSPTVYQGVTKGRCHLGLMSSPKWMKPQIVLQIHPKLESCHLNHENLSLAKLSRTHLCTSSVARLFSFC